MARPSVNPADLLLNQGGAVDPSSHNGARLDFDALPRVGAIAYSLDMSHGRRSKVPQPRDVWAAGRRRAANLVDLVCLLHPLAQFSGELRSPH